MSAVTDAVILVSVDTWTYRATRSTSANTRFAGQSIRHEEPNVRVMVMDST